MRSPPIDSGKVFFDVNVFSIMLKTYKKGFYKYYANLD